MEERKRQVQVIGGGGRWMERRFLTSFECFVYMTPFHSPSNFINGFFSDL